MLGLRSPFSLAIFVTLPLKFLDFLFNLDFQSGFVSTEWLLLQFYLTNLCILSLLLQASSWNLKFNSNIHGSVESTVGLSCHQRLPCTYNTILAVWLFMNNRSQLQLTGRPITTTELGLYLVHFAKSVCTCRTRKLLKGYYCLKIVLNTRYDGPQANLGCINGLVL